MPPVYASIARKVPDNLSRSIRRGVTIPVVNRPQVRAGDRNPSLAITVAIGTGVGIWRSRLR
jgi:hypothetical protein